jgi:hypothetical protein
MGQIRERCLIEKPSVLNKKSSFGEAVNPIVLLFFREEKLLKPFGRALTGGILLQRIE